MKTIEPALTHGEWAARFFRRADMDYVGYNLDGSRYEARAFNMGAEIDSGSAAISVPNSVWYGDARRALAAFLLRGYFTRGMVTAVRECAQSVEGRSADLANDTADFLESLLPPE